MKAGKVSQAVGAKHAARSAESPSGGAALRAGLRAPAGVLALQRAYGNQAVAGLLSRARREAPGALAGTVREKMERAFGVDFSTVRVKQDGAAERLGALAFTQSETIHFAPGRYRPESRAGQELIGHELAHVVQQRAGRVSAPQGKGAPLNTDAALEREADEQGARAARGEQLGARAAGRVAAPSRAPIQLKRVTLYDGTIVDTSVLSKGELEAAITSASMTNANSQAVAELGEALTSGDFASNPTKKRKTQKQPIKKPSSGKTLPDNYQEGDKIYGGGTYYKEVAAYIAREVLKDEGKMNSILIQSFYDAVYASVRDNQEINAEEGETQFGRYLLDESQWAQQVKADKTTKLSQRICKGGLAYACRARYRVHFVIGKEFNSQSVAGEGAQLSVTAKELRFAYKHWDELKDFVTFYKNDSKYSQCDPLWITDPGPWDEYDQRRLGKKK